MYLGSSQVKSVSGQHARMCLCDEGLCFRWIGRTLRVSRFALRSHLTAPVQLGARLKRIASERNAEHDVVGLCRELPARVEQLRLKKGRKLKK